MNDPGIARPNSDSSREARSPIRGFSYQFITSALAWIRLKQDQTLYVECGEDFATHSEDEVEFTQIKERSSTISLRTNEAREAIKNLIELQRRNPGTVVRYQHLTTSGSSEEKNSPFSGIHGIEFWRFAKTNTEKAELLKRFLLEDNSLPPLVKDELSSLNAEEFRTQIVQRLDWLIKAPAYEEVERELEFELAKHGQNPAQGIGFLESSRVSRPMILRIIQECRTNPLKSVGLTLLDFWELFEKETKTLVPRKLLDDLISATGPTRDGRAHNFHASSKRTFQTPSIPDATFRRCALITTLCKTLSKSGLLFIHGSTGMAKSTIAKEIAAIFGGNFAWIQFDHGETNDRDLIDQAITFCSDAERHHKGIVLDGIELSPLNARKLTFRLEVLISESRAHTIPLIFTTQHEPSPTALSEFGATDAEVKRAPEFTSEEISHYALALGAPIKRADTLAQSIFAITDGHPQLVHAALLALRGAGWIDARSLPPESSKSGVSLERSRNRKLLNYLNESESEALYHLTTFGNVFRKDQAIEAITENGRPPNPGAVFDSLCGPWIESVGSEYFRVSPLLTNAAMEDWSNDRLKKSFVKNSTAILKNPIKSPTDISTGLMNAWKGGSPILISSFATSLICNGDEILASVSPHISWLTGLNLNQPFDSQADISWAIRTLQLQVAIINGSENVAAIVNRFDIETESKGSARANQADLRLMFLLFVTVHYQIGLPPERHIKYLVEFDEISRNSSLFEASEVSKSAFQLPNFEGESVVSSLSVFLYASIKSTGLLTELITSLRNLRGDSREPLIYPLKTNIWLSRNLIDFVWLNESELANVTWDATISCFYEAFEFALENEIPNLAVSSARGLAVVHSEYLDDEEKALDILFNLESKIGFKSSEIGQARARIYSNQGLYAEAAEIWGEIIGEVLTVGLPEDLGFLHAIRSAAVAFGKVENWAESASLFLKGNEVAESRKDIEHMVAFKTDAALSFWNAREFRRGVGELLECLPLIDLINPDGNLFAFKILKIYGHLTAWILSQLGNRDRNQFAIPILGACSSPEVPEGFRSLPPFDKGAVRAMLSEIIRELGFEDLFLPVAPRSEIDNYSPESRLLWAISNVDSATAECEFSELPRLIAEVRSFSNEALSNHPDAAARFGSSGDGWATQYLIVACVAAASRDRNVWEIVADWKSARVQPGSADELIEFYSAAEMARDTDPRAAVFALNMSASWVAHVFFALRVIEMAEKMAPENQFMAHLRIVDRLLFSPSLTNKADVYIVKILVKSWEKICERPAFLQRPLSTVPRIRDSLRSGRLGTAKCAEILLAAEPAVSVRLPIEYIRKLKDLL